ncbi:hypothetical protein [uncultured Parvibaculum sp.]|uniref:hypothetical protein n=1 Tax=uncultured Parvibaculum sp. TaxID=291828 RepID=UPI0030EE06AC|tara:strand:+ start:130665 stop:131165 length:501 start_codon:yes stop_codon:yes gene_type:complete
MSKVPPPRQPDVADTAGRNMMRIGLVAMAVVGVVTFFIATGRVQLEEPLVVTATPVQVEPWRADAPLKLDVEVKIANNSDEGLPLNVDSQCEIFRWIVLDAENEFVQSQSGNEPCVDLPVSGFLDPKHSLTGAYALELDPARVRPGDYRLFARYWGYEIRQPFTIE